MKILLKTVAAIFAFSILISCDNNETDLNEDFKIEYGSVCGWCSGDEFITVTTAKIDYSRIIPCGDKKGTKQKSRKISTSEWNEINSSFDHSKFKKLDYNTCNVCADGCDEIIRITENKNIHEIRYSVSDEIEEVKKLRQILSVLLENMREKG